VIGDEGGFDSVALEKYHWVEKIDHVHHAGNSSGIVDGASLVAVGTEEIGEQLGLRPRARILAAVARRFGAGAIAATMGGRESRDQAGYDDQPEATGTSLPRDER